MPRYPTVSETVTQMRSGVFSKVAHRIAAIDGERYPLHVGDTYLEPAPGCRMEDLAVADLPGMHRYALPKGHHELLGALEETRGFDPGRIIVSAGATCGLNAVAAATISPGEEVLILAPFWPLIRGIVQVNHGIAVEVPVLGLNTPEEVVAALRTHCSERTAAVYLNTPNNPTGRVYGADLLTAIADFAAEQDLWVWSDEVYEDYAYRGEHRSIASMAPERTFAVHSFSKAYGMAGNRCGYVVGPSVEAMGALRKATVHGYYSACTASQLAAARVLTQGKAWLEDARSRYQAAGDAAADALGVPRPEGGTFLFLDVEDHLDERGLHGFLVDCIDAGLILAPGDSCGQAYQNHVRVCFTSAPPDVVARGVNVLATLLGRGER